MDLCLYIFSKLQNEPMVLYLRGNNIYLEFYRLTVVFVNRVMEY